MEWQLFLIEEKTYLLYSWLKKGLLIQHMLQQDSLVVIQVTLDKTSKKKLTSSKEINSS